MTSPWKIDGARALLARGAWTAIMDYARPSAGLTEIKWNGLPLDDWCVLGIDAPLESDYSQPPQSDVADWYCRDLDLVATYREAAAPPLRVQTYWRVADDAPADTLAIDLQVSVQTSRLDADPQRKATTCLPQVDVWRAESSQNARFLPTNPSSSDNDAASFGHGCWLFRPNDAGFSYAQFVHPLDYCDDRLISETVDGRQRLRLVHRLFTGDLEKGVILRSRVRGVLLPRKKDEELAMQAYAGLLAAPLPLTT